jgi:hypothetical protein
MARYFYSDSISAFLSTADSEVLGNISAAALMTIEATQQRAWVVEIKILKDQLAPFAGRGMVFFEFAVPRVGKRIDVVVLLDGVLFVLEFKVGEREFLAGAIDQVWDYALDLKNFHETSHHILIAPILVATEATSRPIQPAHSAKGDNVLVPIEAAAAQLAYVLSRVLEIASAPALDLPTWHEGRYRPTPTIIEAAIALYSGHSVDDISTKGADTQNLSETSDTLIQIVHRAREERRKCICFVTGVPGAGKTLVGLNISTTRFANDEGKAVYLSGNGPLVKVLQEALALDRVKSLAGTSSAMTKSEARRAVASFIQNVHHFRDAYLDDQTAPHNHIAIFDEAQRAWDLSATERFMKEKKGLPNFGMSEPEFLISCMDRHVDWAVVVCLVGGGQEINRGEAGIAGWMSALIDRFPKWEIAISPELSDSEYSAADMLKRLGEGREVLRAPALHLATSMRAFRAAGVAGVVKNLLDLRIDDVQAGLKAMGGRYPVVLTRSIADAKKWIQQQARGTERYGMVVSSQAQRLKPHAIDVRVATNPVHWFLKGKDDVRSSFYLEDAATEFDVQGLELDWSCVVWDGDFRFSPEGWVHSSFKGNRWEKISKPERQNYLKNAYRVLLTRARQGMAIVVPEGAVADRTRHPDLYDPTFEYLRDAGIPLLL